MVPRAWRPRSAATGPAPIRGRIRGRRRRSGAPRARRIDSARGAARSAHASRPRSRAPPARGPTPRRNALRRHEAYEGRPGLRRRRRAFDGHSGDAPGGVRSDHASQLQLKRGSGENRRGARKAGRQGPEAALRHAARPPRGRIGAHCRRFHGPSRLCPSKRRAHSSAVRASRGVVHARFTRCRSSAVQA